MSGKGTPTRLIAETGFLQFVKDLLSICKGRVAEEDGRCRSQVGEDKDRKSLQWYFRGYKDGVKVFLEEFLDRVRREVGWKDDWDY